MSLCTSPQLASRGAQPCRTDARLRRARQHSGERNLIDDEPPRYRGDAVAALAPCDRPVSNRRVPLDARQVRSRLPRNRDPKPVRARKLHLTAVASPDRLQLRVHHGSSEERAPTMLVDIGRPTEPTARAFLWRSCLAPDRMRERQCVGIGRKPVHSEEWLALLAPTR